MIRSLGARTDASYKLMGAFAAGSLVSGAAVAGGLGLAGSGIADGLRRSITLAIWFTMIQSNRTGEDLPREIIRAVVRGQLPMSALHGAGVFMDVEENQSGKERRIKVGLRKPLSVDLRPVDLAFGLLEHRDNPDKLREWATFIMSASEVIDLTFLESWPEGEELLEALWDASFEGRVKDAAVRVASALAHE
jgi:hypothetical protein